MPLRLSAEGAFSLAKLGTSTNNICVEKYKSLLSVYLAQDIASDYSFFSVLPPENRLVQSLLSQEFWKYYDISTFLLNSNHLWCILFKLSLEDAVPFICKLDSFFQNEKPSRYIEQVRLHLQYTLQNVYNVTTDDYAHCFDVNAIIDAGSYRYIDDIYRDEKWIIATIEYNVKQATFQRLHSILQPLPKSFQSFVQNFSVDCISVVDTVFGLDEYLNSSDYFDTLNTTNDSDDDYSTIDAIFER